VQKNPEEYRGLIFLTIVLDCYGICRLTVINLNFNENCDKDISSVPYSEKIT